MPIFSPSHEEFKILIEGMPFFISSYSTLLLIPLLDGPCFVNV